MNLSFSELTEHVYIVDDKKKVDVTQEFHGLVAKLVVSRRLQEAEDVIRHYADMNHWLNADLSIINEDFCANEYDFERNGYDKAREYLAKWGLMEGK